MTEFRDIAATLIGPHARNVRRDLGDLTELSASIAAQGLLQPLVVAPEGDEYVLIAGHRRHAAAAKAGVTSLPCIVRTDLDTPAKVIAAMLTENLQRTDLTVMEEADAYAQLELLGVKEAAIVKTTGRSRKTVHERLLLASLPTERREQYESGTLTLDGAVKCAKLRQAHADDTEILALIDGAGTWQFGSGSYGIDSKIARAIEDRNRADQPDEDEGDEDTIDYAAARAEREAEWKQRAERQARLDAVTASTDRMYDWLSGRIAVQAQGVVDGLLDWAIDELISENGHDCDDWAPMLGIDPPGEDEDCDDAQLRIASSAKQLPHQEKVIALALVASGAAKPKPYWFSEHARSMAALGYPLSADDTALMGEQQ